MERRIIIIGTKTAINIKTKFTTRTITTTTPVTISFYIINHVALYMIRKATNYKITFKKNKKSLKPNSGLLIEISLIDLIIDLINDLINIL